MVDIQNGIVLSKLVIQRCSDYTLIMIYIQSIFNMMNGLEHQNSTIYQSDRFNMITMNLRTLTEEMELLQNNITANDNYELIKDIERQEIVLKDYGIKYGEQ